MTKNSAEVIYSSELKVLKKDAKACERAWYSGNPGGW